MRVYISKRSDQAVLDRMSSKKKKDSKKGAGGGGTGANWPSPGSGSGVAAGSLPEPAKSRLWELFGAIEREFEQLHADNGARKLGAVCARAFSRFCCLL